MSNVPQKRMGVWKNNSTVASIFGNIPSYITTQKNTGDVWPTTSRILQLEKYMEGNILRQHKTLYSMWHMCVPGDLSGNGIEWYFLADEQFDDTNIAINDISLFKNIAGHYIHCRNEVGLFINIWIVMEHGFDNNTYDCDIKDYFLLSTMDRFIIWLFGGYVCPYQY